MTERTRHPTGPLTLRAGQMGGPERAQGSCALVLAGAVDQVADDAAWEPKRIVAQRSSGRLPMIQLEKVARDEAPMGQKRHQQSVALLRTRQERYREVRSQLLAAHVVVQVGIQALERRIDFRSEAQEQRVPLEPRQLEALSELEQRGLPAFGLHGLRDGAQIVLEVDRGGLQRAGRCIRSIEILFEARGVRFEQAIHLGIRDDEPGVLVKGVLAPSLAQPQHPALDQQPEPDQLARKIIKVARPPIASHGIVTVTASMLSAPPARTRIG